MLSKKTKFRILASALVIIITVLLLWMFLSGGNFELLKSVFSDDLSRDEIRERLSELGIRGYITVAVLAMLQVVFTFLPAEPVQVISGIAFGFPVGLACCTVGVMLGNSIIFIFYKAFGNSIREYFVENLHINFDKISSSKRLAAIIFILYFLPAIPYGMICFFAVSLGMKYPRYILITVLGSIPSICIGVGLGHIAIATSWTISIIVFAVLLIVLAVVMLKRKAIFDKINRYIDKPPYSSKTAVQPYKFRRILPFYAIFKLLFFFKRVKVRCKNNVGEIDTPSIILCNHGSFIDFAYAIRFIRKKNPHFIVARLYFYNKRLGNLLRWLGCFPKSMFALDIESVKNSLSVLRRGEVLAMMPEARLSTVGKFEDIQEGTYDFLKKAGVPVYTIKMCGDYFASPKWGNGLRRGSLIEAELDILFTKEELEALDRDEIEARVTSRLYYDEFEWLKTRKNVRYRSKKLAEGLENILTVCPVCKQKYTIATKKRDVFCERCGKLATLDDRYSFNSDARFSNFAEWYDWQCERMADEINSDENFELSQPVELKLHSLDGKTFLRSVGQGVCTLNREGLVYRGTKDGEMCEIEFPISNIYRLLFGAGEDFEIYVGREIYYFVPEERRSAVDFYIASIILTGEAKKAVTI